MQGDESRDWRGIPGSITQRVSWGILALCALQGDEIERLCRRVIAETVGGDPEQYTEGFLGKPNALYCSWIQDSQKWGGAIELAILSR
jgi:hypothetical protein